MSEVRAQYKAGSNGSEPVAKKTALNLALPMVDVRHNCGRLLFRAAIPTGLLLEIRCPKCGKLHVIDTRLTSVL